MTTTLQNKLTPEEAAIYAECKRVVADGMAEFVKIGNALLTISDKRLYREEYSTFEEFCQAEYEISASRAYRLCAGAETVKVLPNGQQSQVKNERQARELSKAAPEQREEVLEEAASAEPVTAKAIRKAIQRRQSPAPPIEDDDTYPEPPQVIASDRSKEPQDAIGGINVVQYFAIRVEEIVEEAIAAKASAPQLRALSLACQAGARKATEAAKDGQ